MQKLPEIIIAKISLPQYKLPLVSCETRIYLYTEKKMLLNLLILKNML